mmetsp:Transcript_18973/g.45777  ORF Transcript_18973/g.45777 Transcript_18973/m.45777 type:complete len:398 (-) Transcript_18973:643-1836(-)
MGPGAGQTPVVLRVAPLAAELGAVGQQGRNPGDVHPAEVNGEVGFGGARELSPGLGELGAAAEADLVSPSHGKLDRSKSQHIACRHSGVILHGVERSRRGGGADALLEEVVGVAGSCAVGEAAIPGVQVAPGEGLVHVHSVAGVPEQIAQVQALTPRQTQGIHLVRVAGHVKALAEAVGPLAGVAALGEALMGGDPGVWVVRRPDVASDAVRVRHLVHHQHLRGDVGIEIRAQRPQGGEIRKAGARAGNRGGNVGLPTPRAAIGDENAVLPVVQVPPGDLDGARGHGVQDPVPASVGHRRGNQGPHGGGEVLLAVAGAGAGALVHGAQAHAVPPGVSRGAHLEDHPIHRVAHPDTLGLPPRHERHHLRRGRRHLRRGVHGPRQPLHGHAQALHPHGA